MRRTPKFIALAITSVMLAIQAHAQSFEEGTNIISVGYGFPNLAKSYFSVWDDANLYDRSSLGGFGPLHLKFEHALNEKFGIGLSLNLVSANGKYSYESYNNNGVLTDYTDEFSMSGWSALARLNWHFFNSDKFDPYWGFGIGYRSAKWKYTYGDPDYSTENITAKTLIPLGFEITIGARYYVAENIGIYAETGLAKSIIQFGVSYKFGTK
ncbi:MAG: outer membrane beta-barrel protein [Bacteroidia bacterium]